MKKVLNYFYLLLFPLFFSSCVSSYKQVEVTEVQNVKLLNMTDSTADLEVTMKIANPNKYKIKIKDYDLEAYLNKKPVGKIKLDDKVEMKRKSNDVYTMVLNADMTKVHKILPTMAFADKAIIGLKGNMKVKARGISKKIDIDVNEKVSVKELKNADWSKAEAEGNQDKESQ